VRSPHSTSRDARIALAQLAIGLAFFLSFVLFAIRARFPVPYRDDWDWLAWLLTRPLTFRTIFEPHNEHMIPLPRLLAALQFWLEGSGSHLVFAVALASQFVLGWLFLREIARRWPGDRTARSFAIGATAVCLFFSHQLQSFVFMAAILFPLVQIFAVAAVAGALNGTEPGAKRTFWLVVTALAAACAALTTTNGLVTPLILALVLWVRRGSRTEVAAWAATGLAGLGAYVLLVGRPWLHALPPAGSNWTIPSPGEMLAFFFTFFPSALAYGSLKAAVALGAALFALECFSLVDLARRREAAPRIEVFAVCVMLFATASAAMAAPARAQFGALQAAQSRYASYAMTCNAGLLLWSLSRVYSSGWWSRWRTTATLVTVVATAAIFIGHLFIGQVWIAKADNIAFVKHALLAQVDDDAWIATLHPLTPIVYGTAERLRARGDGLVVDPRIGKPWPESPALEACNGTLALDSLGPNVGWRSTGALAANATSGLIVDSGGVVRGFAGPAPLVEEPNPTEPQVVDVVLHSLGRPAPERAPWLGFAQRGAGGPYTFYALAEGERPICRAALAERPQRVQIYLDAPKGEVSDTAAGGGWAFQCEGAVERLRVFVDGVEKAAVGVERGIARPDVRAAFSRQCDVANGSGFAFLLDTKELPAGLHHVKIAADDSVGRTVESNTTEIVVRRPF
jgi:hypothetical protein